MEDQGGVLINSEELDLLDDICILKKDIHISILLLFKKSPTVVPSSVAGVRCVLDLLGCCDTAPVLSEPHQWGTL